MNLIVSSSRNSATYYVQKSFRSEAGKTTTKIVERLGTLKELIARFGEEDPLGLAREYVAELTAAEKESRHLHGSAGFRTDTQIVSKQRMKSIIVESKKRLQNKTKHQTI